MKKSKLSCIGLFVLVFFTFSIFIPSISLATAPIGEWKFDEGSGFFTTDSSGQEKTGMLFGPPAWVEGVRNKALQFAGSSDYVQVASSVGGGVNSLKNWSVSIYIKPTGSANESYVYSEKDANGNVYFYISITGDNRIKVGTWHKLRAGGWDVYQTGSGVIKRNEWSHLLVTLQNGDIAAGSGIVKCYVNRDSAGTGGLGACRSGVPSLQNIAGASWKAGSGTGLTRLGDVAENAELADFKALYPWSEMKTETKDGHSVVRIPKFYYKRTYDSVNKVHSFWVTKNPTSGYKLHPAFLRNGVEKDYVLVGTGINYHFAGNWGGTNHYNEHPRSYWREQAQNIGTGWQLWDIQTYSALQILSLIEYANTNIGDSYRGISLLFSAESKSYYVNLYNGGPYIDGVNIKDQRVYIAESNFADYKYDEQYKDTGFTLPLGSGSTGNWAYNPTYDWLFLPSAEGTGGGSFSTASGERVAFTKRNILNFYASVAPDYSVVNNTAHSAAPHTGGRYMYIP